jgi:serine/threonine-protein kinase
MVADVVAEPVALTPDERYLAGHYLAYLLGGSRRRGFLRRRPLDPLNADRARVILAMTWLTIRGATDEAFRSAALLLETRPDVRPRLSPVVVVKYLAGRESPAKRRGFRALRRSLQESSPYAREHLTDERGVLNPGLMPQTLDDIRRIAPARTEVDDQLVERWNRVAEVWRERPDFRQAVLGFATTGAARDPASSALWPEAVYPLIERALWQRRLRSAPEVVWDKVLGALHIPEPGNRLDRAMRGIVPRRVVDEIDAELAGFTVDPDVDPFAEPDAAAPADPAERLAAGLEASSLYEMSVDSVPTRGLVRLANPDPVRLTLGDLHALWKEATAAMQAPGARAGHRHVPIGPYRLVVVPSIRGRSAGHVAIQGMRGNKQIEMLTPTLRVASMPAKPIIGAWVYADDSLAIAYVDFQGVVRYISWDAPTGHQDAYDNPADLNHALFGLGLEAPDGLDVALTKQFRPRNPV